MSRTLIVQHWTFHTARVRAAKRLDYQPSDLNGLDLLGFIQGLTTTGRPVDNEPGKRWTRIDSVTPRGARGLLVEASSGRYGEAGDLVDRSSGQVAFSYGEDHAPTGPTRTLVVVPDTGMHAIACYERSSSTGVSGVELLRWLWKRTFLDANTGITWSHPWIDEPEAWLEEASLKAVEVHRYAGGTNTVAADSGGPDEFVHAARARRSRFLGRGTLEAVLKDAKAAHQLVGIDYADGDRVFVEVKVGDRQAKYQIGDGSLPKLQRQLDDGLTDDEFVAECATHLRERVFPELGGGWNSSWVA